VTIDRSKDALVRLPEVRRRVGLSRNTIYRKMDAGKFPALVRLAPQSVAWYESDIDRWVADPMGWNAVA
jgi:prophage regulatory protein